MSFINTKVYTVLVFILAYDTSMVFSEAKLSNCIIKLNEDIDIDSSLSPLILQPTLYYAGFKESAASVYSLNFLYPSLDLECFYFYDINKSSIIKALMRLVCPGHHIIFPADAGVSNVSSASLLAYNEGSLLRATEYSPLFYTYTLQNNPVKCSGVYEPVMKGAKNKYEIGYQINVLDFLPVYTLFYNLTKQVKIVAQAKVSFQANTRINITDGTKYKNGLLYESVLPNILQIYNTKNQLINLQERIDNETLRNAYTSGDNYLVPAQLISKNDLFYNPEKRSTYFFENTVPVWKSIAEGNWNSVGDIIRELAQETRTIFDIYVGTIDNLHINGKSIYLCDSSKHDPNNSIPVPKFLFKVAIDPSTINRGIVFITINDPFAHVSQEDFLAFDEQLIYNNRQFSNEYIKCNKITDCYKIYPEFGITRRGFTYCCGIDNFIEWNKIKHIVKSPFSGRHDRHT